MCRLKRRSVRLGKLLVLGLLFWSVTGCTDEPTPAPSPTSSAALDASPTASAAEAQATAPAATEVVSTPTSTPVTPVQSNALNLIQSFVDAPYRVVAVAKSPLAPYSLIVATERSTADCGSPEDPQRCVNDETCGSLYTSSTCYFFVEPAFHAEADPATRYVSRWPDEPTLAAFQVDSLRFIDARTVEFLTAGGDGLYSVEETWWLDLVTGALAMQSRVERDGGAP